MSRPHIIRADTIDLQAHEAPSAQSHQRPTPDRSLAPHQAETLREVAAEVAEENLRTPGVSWDPGPNDIQDLVSALDPATGSHRHGSGADTMRTTTHQDALAVAQNGGLAGQEVDDGDLDGDAEVDLDDDMMDKISSSPSIEDGGSTFALPTAPSSIVAPLPQSTTFRSPSSPLSVCDPRSSSPYLESPDQMGKGGPELRQRAAVLSHFVSSTGRHHHRSSPRGQLHNSEFRTNATTNDDALSDTSNAPGGLDFDDSLPWVDEDESDYVTPEIWNEDEGPTYRGRVGQWLDTADFIRQTAGAPNDLIVPNEYDEDNDDDGDFSEIIDSRFIDSGWGGECLQDTEDIDFDFVYALHTFVATVEGQANATKGDTMVLLDDSNSYWWLLSASMLGDQPDKARNPIRSAMKRRKTKNVQFAAPTYVDYSDVDYSTEEEDADARISAQQQQEQQSQQSRQSSGNVEMEDETAKVEPLKPKSQQKQAKTDTKRQESSSEPETSSANKAASRTSEDAAEAKVDGPKKTRDGTVRDSFFKDDTVETKKITLTPNLLRDDNAPRESTETREVKQRPSLDKLEKDNVFSKDDKKKKKDKDKDKKPGGLRGFFSRKDKKMKGEDDDDSFGKRSLDADAPEKDVEEDEPQALSEKTGPQRHPSKLQKQPRGEPSPTRRSNSVRERENAMDVKSFLSEGRVNNVANVPPATMRLVESSPKGSPQENPRGQKPDRDSSPVKGAAPKAARAEPRSSKTTVARSRAELDDVDGARDTAPGPAQQAPMSEDAVQHESRAPSQANMAPAAQAMAGQAASKAPAISIPQQAAERLSESPVQVSPVAAAGNPPPLVVDNASQAGEDGISPLSTPSPELVEREEAVGTATPSQKPTSTTPSTTRSESWDDASLRAFFDSGSDIRDLLLVVYDKNDVDDVGLDHPVAGSLFREQNAKLAEITTRLDDMLGDWLARKQRLRGSV
ncbi:hypothetical protein P885DRAFT_25965 [Corynascus similis CBS 632.67]